MKKQSGWIKFEKDLRQDRRVQRMADNLMAAEGVSVTDVTQMRITLNRYVTLVLGSLAQLWMYADSHIREDDTLDLGADEIDQLVGVRGFSQMLPQDWLQVLDEHRSKLPDFHTHNGTVAKKKALTAKRVARHRIRNVIQESNGVTPECNAAALPDQTRPDHTRPVGDARTRAADRKSVPRETDRSRAAFLRAKASYPAGTFTDSEWLLGEREFNARLDEGESPDDLVAGSAAYALQQQAMGNERTRFITKPSKFFNGTGMWRGPFPIPQAPAGKPEDDPAARAAFDALVATDGAQRDARTERALAQFGGWSRWKLRRVGEEARLKAEFCRAFTDAAETAPESNAGGAGAAIGKNPTRRPGETKTAQKLSALFSAQGGKRK